MYRLAVPRFVPRAAARVSQRRRIITGQQPQSSSGPNRRETIAAYGGNTALLVGGVTLLAAIGYYMTRRDDGKGRPPSTGDVKQQARDVRDATKAKGNAEMQQAKSRVQEDVERARATADSAIDRTRTAAHDIKTSAGQRAAATRDTIVGTAEDAKREAEREAERAKAAGAGWFAWGKDKAEENQENAAKGVARKAESARVAAEKQA